MDPEEQPVLARMGGAPRAAKTLTRRTEQFIGDRVRFELDTAKNWAEFPLVCGLVIALPIGAWWVVDNFSAEDTREANPNTSVTADVMAYDADRRLLLVHVRPKNAGRVPIELEGGKEGDIKITIGELPATS